MNRRRRPCDTGVAIDLAGNVWVTNSWLIDAFENLYNPGGHGLVVFIGLAASIRTSLIGPPGGNVRKFRGLNK